MDYDTSKSPIAKQRRRQTTSIAVRGAQLDIWTRQFLANHDRPVVLQIGAGLDSRVFRVDPGPDVDWYDIDFPDVIALRERFYPTREHYHLVASSATDLSWLDAIPADRPALFIAEGVSMYLTESDGIGLLRRVVERFPAGELQLDFWSRFGSKAMRKNNTVVRWSNSELGWSVDEPDDILSAVPGTRLIRAILDIRSRDGAAAHQGLPAVREDGVAHAGACGRSFSSTATRFDRVAVQARLLGAVRRLRLQHAVHGALHGIAQLLEGRARSGLAGHRTRRAAPARQTLQEHRASVRNRKGVLADFALSLHPGRGGVQRGQNGLLGLDRLCGGRVLSVLCGCRDNRVARGDDRIGRDQRCCLLR